MDTIERRLAAAAKAHQKAQARADDTREQLHAAILAAVDAGMRQVDIVRITGYTRERIRLLVRRPTGKERGE